MPMHVTYTLRQLRGDATLFAAEVQIPPSLWDQLPPGCALAATQYLPARHDGGGPRERDLPLRLGEDGSASFVALCREGEPSLAFGLVAWDGAEPAGSISAQFAGGELRPEGGEGALRDLGFERTDAGPAAPALSGEGAPALRVVYAEAVGCEPLGLVLYRRGPQGDDYAIYRFWRSRAHADQLFCAEVARGSTGQVFPLEASADYWVAPGLEVRCQSGAAYAPWLAEEYSWPVLAAGRHAVSGARVSRCLYCATCNDFVPIAEPFTSVDAGGTRRACPHLAFCRVHRCWETNDAGTCPATISPEDSAGRFALFRATILQCEATLAAWERYDLYRQGEGGLWTGEGYRASATLRSMIRHARASVEDALASALSSGLPADIAFWGGALAWSDRGRVPPGWDIGLVQGEEARRERVRVRMGDFLPEASDTAHAPEALELAVAAYIDAYEAEGEAAGEPARGLPSA
jgi:hypothetical protein